MTVTTHRPVTDHPTIDDPSDGHHRSGAARTASRLVIIAGVGAMAFVGVRSAVDSRDTAPATRPGPGVGQPAPDPTGLGAALAVTYDSVDPTRAPARLVADPTGLGAALAVTYSNVGSTRAPARLVADPTGLGAALAVDYVATTRDSFPADPTGLGAALAVTYDSAADG